MTIDRNDRLPSLEESIEALHRVEKKYDEGERIRQTRRALQYNEQFAVDAGRVGTYYAHLTGKEMFRRIYGTANMPSGVPIAMPAYLIEILDASARVLFALSRKELREKGPQLLLERMTGGWLSERMAERLHGYYLTTEPDMAFDVLVYGKHTARGMTFDEFKTSNDYLDAKILEAQSVDTYFGWIHEYLIGARKAGLGAECAFTNACDAEGRRLSDAGLDGQVLSTLKHGLEDDPSRIVFMEIEPENQPSGQNLEFTADLMCGGRKDKRPFILDPADLFPEDGKLWAEVNGKRHEIRKVISRIVEADLEAYVKKRQAAGEGEVIERLKRIYDTPEVFPDLSKHLAGFFLIDKSSITNLCLLGEVNIAPKTRIITREDVERFMRDPAGLKDIAIKPLHGMSAMGVSVSPSLDELKESVDRETTLQQEIIWATPIMPNLNREIEDPDVQAGICSETRLVMHAGSRAVAHQPHRARMIAGLSRSHYTSKDPARKIKGDPKHRGWFSNMGAILMVKVELGIQEKNDTGLGMAPVYWLD